MCTLINLRLDKDTNRQYITVREYTQIAVIPVLP